MPLTLHAGASPVDCDDRRGLPIPAPTHVNISHQHVVDMLKYSLGLYGHEIVAEY